MSAPSRVASHFVHGRIDGRDCWVVHCARCDATGHVPTTAPPESAKKGLERIGWQFKTTNKALCPRCGGTLREEKTMTTKATPPQVLKLQSVVSPTVLRSLMDDEKRRVRELLLAHFDDGLGRYAAGWTDVRIATEANVPAANVAAFREFVFGPLKVDPEIAAIKDEIDRMVERLAELSDRVRKLEAKA